ncbi:class I lanthipeptide [Chitinophaga sp. 30R24]|uniref:class I lanthipeptide n=1 Tax=Chitinophaga sp. 30R24 TaxID=3248838 RepID=UPI003B8F3ACC
MKKTSQAKLQLNKIVVSKLNQADQLEIKGRATGKPCQDTLTCPNSYVTDCPSPITYLQSYCAC